MMERVRKILRGHSARKVMIYLLIGTLVLNTSLQSSSIKRWLSRAAEQCEKINGNLMKGLDIPQAEIDEL